MSYATGALEYLIAFVSLMDAVLVADSSVMHIAGCLGVPGVALFGMTDGSKRTSYYPSMGYIQGPAECSPCDRIMDQMPCNKRVCEAIASIPPQFVVQSTLEVLERENHENQGLSEAQPEESEGTAAEDEEGGNRETCRES